MYDPSITSGLVCSSETARIVTWNNVVIQSVSRADLSFARSFGAIMRKQVRAYPDGIVSLAILRPGLKPAPKDVRHDLTQTVKDTEGSVHHVLVVEETGLLAQLLVTVIRGVMMIGGKNLNYILPADRADAVHKVVPLLRTSARSGQHEQDLAAAIAYCCEPH